MTLDLRALIERLENGLAIRPAQQSDDKTYDAARDVAYIHQI